MWPVDMALLNLFPQATSVAKHASDKYILRERVLERGVKASHLAEPLLLEGPDSTLVCQANEAFMRSSKDLERCIPQSDASGREQYPRLTLEMSKRGINDALPFNMILEKEGDHYLCSATRPLLDHSPDIFQGREKLFQGESTCNGGKEWNNRDEPSSFVVQGLSNRFEAEEIDCTEQMIPHNFSKKREEGSDFLCHGTDLVKVSSPFHTGQQEEDLPSPHYSGWERLSIEQALQQMSEVYSADNYMEKCVCLIQKCRTSGCVAIAQRVYAHICDNGLEAHGVLGSYLIAMFVHSSSLPMAQQAFDRLCHHNEYSWTDLLKGYVEVGDPEYGLNLFSRMKEAGIRPGKIAYVAVLRACGTLKCIKRGQQLHTEIVKVLDEDLNVTQALVDFYAKCDLSEEARDIFDDLQYRMNGTSITGCADQQLHEKLVDCLGDMQAENVFPIATTFVSSLKACSSVKDLTRGRELHLQVVKEGNDLDRFVSNTLVDMYAKCGLLSESAKVLSRISGRDVVSWTALITGCVEYGECEDALKYSEMMRKEGVPPNGFTLASCVKACGSTRALDSGQKLHAEIMKEGLYTDFVICNSLVDMYAKCGSLEEAQTVFDKLARQDIISWTSLIAGYTDHGYFKEAINCFEQMQNAGVSPNIITFICCLKACAFMADLDMGHKLHNDLVKEEFETHIFIGNALVRMYSRCGLYSDAQAVFDDLPRRDVVSWTILISELAEDGHGEQALKIFEQMHGEGASPNSFTYVCSLKACGSIGAIEKGRTLHIEIIKRGLERVPFVFKALIGMYAECGNPINLPCTP